MCILGKLQEQMMRKKQAQHLDARYVTMVENAYYYCNPPPMEKTVRKKRPPLQEYIRKLLYKDLSKVTTEKVRVLIICLSLPPSHTYTTFLSIQNKFLCLFFFCSGFKADA